MDSSIQDTFNGNNEHLKASIKALINLNDDNALVPHGIGGHARGLLAAAYHRLSDNGTPSVSRAPANCYIEQLTQIAQSPVWDGNLIGKHTRDELVKAGLVGRWGGWNFLTEEGIKYAINLHILSA